MKVKVQRKIGNAMVTFESKDADPVTAWKFTAFHTEIPAVCGKCGSVNIYAYHRDARGNVYCGLHCNDCTAELTFHQYRDNKGFYLTSDDEWKVFQRTEPQAVAAAAYGGPQETMRTRQPQQTQELPVQTTMDDDIPF